MNVVWNAAAFAGVWTLALACTVSLALDGCARKPSKPSGEALYQRHCVSCHGPGGRGDGPLADTLKRRPADLTELAKRDGGRVDEAKLMSFIDGRRAVAEHGAREMPVWGEVFAEDLASERYREYTGLLLAQSLAEYVASLQK